ncbi:hypothetical protein [Kocuria marina]|uniref:hypothetical protein n=1 Tax=Kocuria marina TaxID=223184 RepID=UPI0022E1C162|nr:hypothetical protein [Kocuria marina]
MKISAQLLAVPVLLLGLTACAGSSDAPASAPTAPSVEPAIAETTQAQPTSGLSERGNVMKRVGESASITINGQESTPVVNFVVNGIEVDPKCTNPYAEKPENGHFVTLDVSAETGPREQFQQAFQGSEYMFNPFDWKFITPSGTTANSVASTPAFSCLTQAEQISEMGPAERATGKIVLDVPAKTGTLIYAPGFVDQAWEWKL